ncbi:MAG TPA: hypothetical protein PLG04_07590 [Anaerolineaceae bacterium]|nr:hypothetical protein [Anaerolineaceae bacterium]HRT28728.1 hypothetical protein [Kiritimatiellia bacterium]
MRVDLIAVEGAHDLALVQRLLSAFGFEQKRKLDNPKNPSENIPSAVKRLIPDKFPANEERDIHKRPDVPAFHVKDEQCVTLIRADGDSKLVGGVSLAIHALSLDKVYPSSIGFILDADNNQPMVQFDGLRAEWFDKSRDDPLLKKYPLPSSVGVCTVDTYSFGVFVMPDNQSSGSLETLLLRRAKDVYPVLHEKADEFIQVVKNTKDAIPPGSELGSKGQNEGKAVLHAMTSVLKPGKTLQASISDNEWVPQAPDQFPDFFYHL